MNPEQFSMPAMRRLSANIAIVAALLFAAGLLLLASYANTLEAVIGGAALVVSFPVALIAHELLRKADYAQAQGGAMQHAGNFGALVSECSQAANEAFEEWTRGNMRVSAVALENVASNAKRAAQIARDMAEQFEE